MPECCRVLAERVDEPYRTGLRNVYENYKQGEQTGFPGVFCERMEACLQELPLKKEDKELFFRPFKEQGFRDGTMQLKCFEQGLAGIYSGIDRLEKELRGKCNMAVGLGALSGLLVLIILL